VTRRGPPRVEAVRFEKRESNVKMTVTNTALGNRRSVHASLGRLGLLAGAAALVVPVGAVAAGDEVSTRGKAVPVSSAQCTVPDSENPGIGGSGSYSGIRTGAITRIEVTVENTTDSSTVVVDGFVYNSTRTTGQFVFSIPATDVAYDAGDSIRAYVNILGRRNRTLSAYGYFTCG
jgi:hypothetical protein